MAPRKTAAAKVETVEEVEETPAEEVEEFLAATASAPAPVVQEEVVTPTTKRGIPNNTWTLTYGAWQIDLVEGQETDLPLPIYEYLKRHGNLVARL